MFQANVKMFHLEEYNLFVINLLFSVRNLEEKFDNRAPVVIIIIKKIKIYIYFLSLSGQRITTHGPVVEMRSCGCVVSGLI